MPSLPSSKTPLFSFHERHGAKMATFAGYVLPTHYQSIIQEHEATRNHAGLFDVSHMGRLLVKGPKVDQALESVLAMPLRSLPKDMGQYGLMLNQTGGVIDDLIATRLAEDCFLLVLNAACKDSDLAHLQTHLPDTIETHWLDTALLALQGPQSEAILSQALALPSDHLSCLYFMQSLQLSYEGTPLFIQRCGYTGEDGFELACDPSQADKLAEKLTQLGARPAGLGARDSLRLEAGLCLYGNDLDTATTPLEAALMWTIRKDIDTLPSLGSDALRQARAANQALDPSTNPSRSRVCLRFDSKIPIRQGAKLMYQGQSVGQLSSGAFGPTLGSAVGMGYIESWVKKALQSNPDGLTAEGKKGPVPAWAQARPWFPSRYHLAPKA